MMSTTESTISLGMVSNFWFLKCKEIHMHVCMNFRGHYLRDVLICAMLPTRITQSESTASPFLFSIFSAFRQAAALISIILQTLILQDWTMLMQRWDPCFLQYLLTQQLLDNCFFQGHHIWWMEGGKRRIFQLDMLMIFWHIPLRRESSNSIFVRWTNSLTHH